MTPSGAQATTRVDAVVPTSTISPLPTLSPANFTVTWGGQDDVGGSGIASYDVFVSDNAGPCSTLLIGTTLTSTMFTGVDGHTYAFYSVATDNVGNREATPSGAQATTRVDAVAPTSSVLPLPGFSPASFTVSWSGQDDAGGSGIGTYDVFVSDNSGPFTALLTGTVLTSTGFAGVDGHTYAFYSVATDNVGHREATSSTVQVTTRVDAVAPTSSVSQLPGLSPASFMVGWSGQDDAGGSGIASYNLFVSDNGGPFTALLTGTSLTSTTFTGIAGHTYGFYSVAADNVGNRKAKVEAAEATTTIGALPTSAVLGTNRPNGSRYGEAISFTVTVSADDTRAGVPSGSVQWLVDAAEFGLPIRLTNGTCVFLTTDLPAGSHSLTIRYTSGSPNFADTTSSPLSQIVSPTGLTVTADSLERTYGAANPVLSGNLTGLQHNDPITASFNTAATARSHVAAYTIVATLNDPDGKLSNYTVTVVGGTLSVTPASLTITANDQSKVFWAPLPALTASYAGFVNGDTLASLTTLATLATAATAHSPVGSYPIAVTGGVAADYSLSYVAGTLTVSDCHWQNPVNPYDVTGEGDVTPSDVLHVITYINANPNNTSLPPAPASPPPFYNVNGDDAITPLDVLVLISYINDHPLRSPEGEALPAASGSASELVPTATDTNATLIGSSRDRPLSPMANPAMGWLMIPPPWSSKAEDWSALATQEVTGTRRTNGQWGSEVSKAGDAPHRTLQMQTEGIAGSKLGPVGLDSVLTSEECLWAPWEDVLQNLAADVDLAWHGT